MSASTSYGAQNIQFEYDWRGRRIRKRVSSNSDGTGTVLLDQRFIYDGWNLIAVLSASSTEDWNDFLNDLGVYRPETRFTNGGHYAEDAYP